MNIDQKNRLAVIISGLLVVAAFFWIACAKPAQSSTQEGAFNVEFLFEHDGVKVYRFTDHGNPVYFTSQGDAQSRVSTGKYILKQHTLNGEW